MILADQNEVRNQPELIGWLRQSVEVQEGSFNQTAGSSIIYPDFVVVGGEQLVGINRKTVNELLSSPEKVLEQIQRELAGPVEQLILLVEGICVPDGNSGAWAYSMDWGNIHLYQNTDQRGTVPFRRQHSKTNWTHVQNVQTRLEFLGVQVVHSYSLYDTATKLVSIHDLVVANLPNKVLDKLFKPSISILALDPVEKAMATTLVGVAGAGWGEELALTVAALGFKNIGELFTFWSEGDQLCDTMLRSGTRRIGNAAEIKLQRALGWSGLPSPGVQADEGLNSEVRSLPQGQETVI